MKPFKFKKFIINQDRCAMKVGTDTVLLGSWTPIEQNPLSILDIGSGTGILSLMLAQRSHAEIIDAIEIDDDAYEQCVENFEQSVWSDRLFCYHASLLEFTKEIDEKYDLVVSNPPFYSASFAFGISSKGGKKIDTPREIARHNNALPFDHLLHSVSKLLSKHGMFSVIIPYKEEEIFRALASKFDLYPNEILHVKGSPNSEIKRSLIVFSFSKMDFKTKELIIETSRHEYTKDYINLSKDFYLKM